jgi:pimeloyl-ACP methyl ester carboxylesterase
MPTFELNGATVHYGDEGLGDPLVLLHAAGSSGAQWRGMLPHLTPRYRVITPDLYGHGRTDAWPDPDTLTHEDQAALLKAIVEHTGIGPFDLVGHSYGGATALRYILQNPDMVKRLVVIEPMLLNLLIDAGEDDVLAELYKMSKGFLNSVETHGPEYAWKEFLDFRNGKLGRLFRPDARQFPEKDPVPCRQSEGQHEEPDTGIGAGDDHRADPGDQERAGDVIRRADGGNCCRGDAQLPTDHRAGHGAYAAADPSGPGGRIGPEAPRRLARFSCDQAECLTASATAGLTRRAGRR